MYIPELPFNIIMNWVLYSYGRYEYDNNHFFYWIIALLVYTLEY